MSRRKFGSSFIVETTVRLGAAGLAALTAGGSAPLGRLAGRAEPAGRARVLFLRDDAALARADCVLTCADLRVAVWEASERAATPEIVLLPSSRSLRTAP